MTVELEQRNAELTDLVELLQYQNARKFDVVAPASQIMSMDGLIRLKGVEPVLTEDGVTLSDGTYRPTAVFDEGLADKLGIPLAYVRRMREQRSDLFDKNVNGWLHGKFRRTADGVETLAEPDGRKFLVRCFQGADGTGVGRAFLSDRFRIVDNLDVLVSALDGIRDAGLDVQIDSCDLTERRMHVKVVAPEVRALAPLLMEGYRNPFRSPDVTRANESGWRPTDDGQDPVVFAGFVLSNSETGGGAFTITPRLMVKVCRNGLVIAKDAMRNVHLGGKLDEGVIEWSGRTQQKNVELIRSQTSDAVRTFLDVDYMAGVIRGIEEKAGATVERPEDAIKVVGKALKYDQTTIDGVLSHFVRVGQLTAGGVMNAVTSYAQTVSDPDAANEIESSALRALDLIA